MNYCLMKIEGKINSGLLKAFLKNSLKFLIPVLLLTSNYVIFSQDTDGDGVNDDVDLDDDNDGIPDALECPLVNVDFMLDGPFDTNGSGTGTFIQSSGGTGTWGITQNFTGGNFTGGDIGANGDLFFGYDGPNVAAGGWDLNSVFTVTGAGNLQIALIGNQGEGDAFGSRFSNYTIQWTGGLGDAIMVDPLSQTNIGNGAVITNGSSFTQLDCELAGIPGVSCNGPAVSNSSIAVSYTHLTLPKKRIV